MHINDAAYFDIDLLHGGFRHAGGLSDRAAQEDFTFIFSVHHRPQSIGHPITGDHVTSNASGTLKVIARASGHLIHEHLFSDTTTKQHADLVQHEFFVVAVTIFFGQAHGHTQSTATRNDGDLVHRITLGQELANQSVARLVVRRVAALFFRHDHALALWAHQDFVFGFLKVLHLHHASVTARSHQGCFVTQVGQVSTAHARCTARNHAGVDVLGNRHFAHMDVQDLFATTDIGQGHVHLTVKTTGAQQSGVQNVRAIGGCDHDHAKVGLETIHLDQHLVQSLFAFVITAAHTSTTLTAHSINFVNEDDARRILFGIFEHIAHASCTHAHKHLNEI